MGPRAGQIAFTLRSLPGTLLPQPSQPFLASADGFSLHAGVAAGADERKKVERLCRYLARPARYHGVFAPHSRWRAEVPPAGRGKPTAPDLRTPAELHRALP